MNEVVVRSFKQNRDLRLEPLSASSVTGTAIQNKNITGIKEFSSFIPNLFMPDYGSKLTSPVYIRGIGSKINAPSVGLYVDGIPYFEKSAFDFDFAEIDRVEVLRGPQGTLYGRNTMGGIINVYTKSPLKFQGTNASISNGTYGAREYALSRYAKIGEKFGYSLSADYNRSDGYFTNTFTDKKADATTLVPNDSGHIIVNGLEDDTYTLTEIATDKGYVLLKDGVEIVIAAAESENACETCGAKLLTASGTVNGEPANMESGNAIVPLMVINNPGFDLPKTGGYGTWMFTVGGCMLLGVAAFIVIRGRKHNKNDQ